MERVNPCDPPKWVIQSIIIPIETAHLVCNRGTSAKGQKAYWSLYICLMLQKHKCVPLEDLAAEFKLRTQVNPLWLLLHLNLFCFFFGKVVGKFSMDMLTFLLLCDPSRVISPNSMYSCIVMVLSFHKFSDQNIYSAIYMFFSGVHQSD